MQQYANSLTPTWVFAFPGPQPFAWPSVLALTPICIYWPWPPICINRSWPPKLYLPALANNSTTSLGPDVGYTDLVFSFCVLYLRPWPTICITGLGPYLYVDFRKLGKANLSVYAHKLLSKFSVESNEHVPSFYKKQEVA